MKKILLLFAAAAICGCSNNSKVTLEQIDKEENLGNFSKANYLIDLMIAQNNLPEDSLYQLDWRKEKMRRIALDFSETKESVLDYAVKYYPNISADSLLRWESSGALEFMIINGQKRYFKHGAENLFLLDSTAKARKELMASFAPNPLADTLQQHIPTILNTVKTQGGFQAVPVKMNVKYSVTLKANAVPDGETVRCWLPFVRDDNRRQTEVALVSVNDDNYLISPNDYAHKSIYMEKTAQKDEPLKFEIEFSYRSAGEWFDVKQADIKPFNKNSEIYRNYTAERPPHIVFSDSIKALSKLIVGEENNVYQKVRKIFGYLDSHYPWASAREYSTIDNIPQHVIDNGHGDCGQVTLLFITLARYNGIPARWQSGFMTHPHAVNLHDWGEYYVEGLGWIPIDQSFGVKNFPSDSDAMYFYSNGIDSYRMVVNNDYSMPLYPEKIYPRSDNVDFQRGELEWRGGNLYYDKWDWNIKVSYF
ncbi:MAG: transglutaminase domain-containing protein [Dysgonamonadaceae bacterium]|jgi:hypothetical protein|nr:transglutaminase domain-containing protein [Dysgonamonadaceae bacterium]